MKRIHQTAAYLLAPVHPVTILVIGAGGTGSQVLASLVRIHLALKAMGHPGFHVTCMDEDKVSQANIGRQLFSPSDVDLHKSTVLISRINRSYGLQWCAVQENFNTRTKMMANIIITCVDSIKARLAINKIIFSGPLKNTEPYEFCHYWMDFGNTQTRGQVILGTVRIADAKSSKKHELIQKLPSLFEEFQGLSEKEDIDTGPSCSLAEALTKQDLFINSTLVQFGMNLIWKMFRNGHLEYRGGYVNLDTMITKPIPV